jgi:hypothetical protein
MPVVGFEHTTPEFERAKRVYALDNAATAIGKFYNYVEQIIEAEEETYLYISILSFCVSIL